MSTSQTTSLAEPIGTNKIGIGTLAYVRTRNQHRAYDLVIRELKKSGITQADLARRLDKGQDAISRLLSRPRNWEMDTFSDLLFAISGALPKFDTEHPAKHGTPTNVETNLARATETSFPVSPKAKSNNPEIQIIDLRAA